MNHPNPDNELTTLKDRLVAEGIEFQVSTLAECLPAVYGHDTLNGPDLALNINGWAANWDRWGYVIDRASATDDTFLDQGDLDAAIAFIRENVL